MINMNNRIPESEMKISYATSGGPGGQGVNTGNTKVVLWWKVSASKALTDGEKARLQEELKNRLNREGEVVIHASEHRSREQNLTAAINRLNTMVESALVVPAERVPTQPTRASRERRMGDKRRQAARKKDRQLRFNG